MSFNRRVALLVANIANHGVACLSFCRLVPADLLVVHESVIHHVSVVVGFDDLAHVAIVPERTDHSFIFPV